MKKTLLTIASMALTVCAVAQVNGRIAKNSTTTFNSKTTLHSITAGVAATTCDTIGVLTGTGVTVGSASSDTVTPGCSPNAGYVYGTNCYGDLEKANFYPAFTYSTLNSPQVTGVIVGIYKNGTEGTGGVATNTVGMTLYAGTSNTAAPGTMLGSVSKTIGQVLAAQPTPTTTLFLYTFDFTTPISVPTTGFFASVVLPNTPGDTLVAVNQASAAVNMAWEKWSDNSWKSIIGAWGTNGILYMFPKVCGTVGITENLGLSKNVTVFPNPTSGLVNIAAILTEKTNLTVTVTNALGQTLINNKYNEISNELLSLDLSNLNNGVYFVTVSNGTDKMVQRMVLNK